MVAVLSIKYGGREGLTDMATRSGGGPWSAGCVGYSSNDQMGRGGGTLKYAFFSQLYQVATIILISILVTRVATLILVLEELSTYGFCLVYMATLDY